MYFVDHLFLYDRSASLLPDPERSSRTSQSATFRCQARALRADGRGARAAMRLPLTAANRWIAPAGRRDDSFLFLFSFFLAFFGTEKKPRLRAIALLSRLQSRSAAMY